MGIGESIKEFFKKKPEGETTAPTITEPIFPTTPAIPPTPPAEINQPQASSSESPVSSPANSPETAQPTSTPAPVAEKSAA